MLKDILVSLRNEKEVTQSEVASHLAISRQAYNNYEVGIREPSLEAVVLLAKYFDVSVDYLLGRTQQKKPISNDRDGLLEAIRSDPRKLDIAKLIFSLDEQGLAKLEKLFDIVQSK